MRTQHWLATFAVNHCEGSKSDLLESTSHKWSRSVVSDSLRPRGLYPTRFVHPWSFLGKSTGVGCHFLLQGIFLTQGSNPGLLHCGQTLYHLSHQGSPTLVARSIIFRGGKKDGRVKVLQWVTWGVVSKRWDSWLKGVECAENSGGLLPHGIQRWLERIPWLFLQWP